MTFLPTTPATLVDDSVLETEASWNTVLASTLALVFTLRIPKPLAYRTLPAWTTATATPGTPVLDITPLTIWSSSSTAAWNRAAGIGTSDCASGGTCGPGGARLTAGAVFLVLSAAAEAVSDCRASAGW